MTICDNEEDGAGDGSARMPAQYRMRRYYGTSLQPLSGGDARDLIFLREIKIFIVFDERIAAVCAYYV